MNVWWLNCLAPASLPSFISNHSPLALEIFQAFLTNHLLSHHRDLEHATSCDWKILPSSICLEKFYSFLSLMSSVTTSAKPSLTSMTRSNSHIKVTLSTVFLFECRLIYNCVTMWLWQSLSLNEKHHECNDYVCFPHHDLTAPSRGIQEIFNKCLISRWMEDS